MTNGTVAEHMRIEGSTGYVKVGTTSAGQFTISGEDGIAVANIGHVNGTADGYGYIIFRYNDTVIGRIDQNGTSGVSYVTSSDYRLKENVVTDWDATTRLKQLKPSRFNFIADGTDRVVDGFLAHEVSSIVPEAISGTKDATEDITNVVLNADGTLLNQDISEADWEKGKLSTTDADGNTVDPIYASDTTWTASKTVPVYQGIDQSKIVPLLTKTILELEARITALESA